MYRVIIGIILIALFISCNNENRRKGYLNNKEEIDKFLLDYIEDTLKYKSAKFLVDNMKYYFSERLDVDTSNIIDCDTFKLYNSDILNENHIRYLDSLNVEINVSRYLDVDSISTEFLTHNIEISFDVWENNSWSQNYSFDTYKEYILPYRIGFEVVGNWRDYFNKRYFAFLKEKSKTNSIRQLSTLIKREISKWYNYKKGAIHLKNTQDLKDRITYGFGNCLEVANTEVMVFRALGIAAAVDCVPLCGISRRGHCISVCFDEEEKPVISLVDILSLNRVAKVYRFNFSVPKDNIFNKVKRVEDIPPILRNIRFFDVTSDYVAVHDVSIKLSKKLNKEPLYLSSYNADKWEPIAWTMRNKNGKYVFRNMGKSMVYLPTSYKSNNIRPEANPIIVDARGNIRSINIRKDSLIRICLKNPRIKNDTISELFELEYWNDAWISAGSHSDKNNSVIYNSVPSNTLYRLKSEEQNNYNRIFTYKNGEVRRW